MQYKVPQSIDKEDQIVGSLTLLEFSYLAIGGAFDVLFYQTMGATVRWLPIFIVSIIALALSFLKIQDRPLLYFIMAAINYMFTPKKRVWDKDSLKPIVKIEKKPVVVEKSLHKDYDADKVEKFIQAVDTHGHIETTSAESPSPFKNVDINNDQAPMTNDQ